MKNSPDHATSAAAGRKDKYLLCCRMAKLGLDFNSIEHTDARMFAELKQRCAACEYPDACAVDLRDDPTNPTWEAYCPNSARLTALADGVADRTV